MKENDLGFGSSTIHKIIEQQERMARIGTLMERAIRLPMEQILENTHVTYQAFDLASVLLESSLSQMYSFAAQTPPLFSIKVPNLWIPLSKRVLSLLFLLYGLRYHAIIK